jgi:cell division protein FtsI/penicillin-binding protein 2
MSTTSAINRRITVVHGAMLLAVAGLIGRMAYLQAWQGPDLKSKAQAQQMRTIPLAAKRGLILDHSGQPMAMNLPTYSLYAQPREFKQSAAEIAGNLAPILGRSIDEVVRSLQGESFRFLTRRLDEGQADRVRRLKLAGVGLIRESRRIYPNGPLAGPLLGFVGIDNQGLAGMEISFDKMLRADSETLTVFTDALGQEVLRQGDNLPLAVEKVEGNHVITSLDTTLQHVVERRLKASIDKLHALRGGAMVMDLQNGDMLAMATAPSFDPNHFGDAKWEHIKNWLITDQYEPGSTMKMFTLAAALDAGVLSMNESVVCPGQITVERWRVHDHGESPNTIRYLRPMDILEVSSNVGCSIIGRRMKPETHRRILNRFGFGRTTGSRLSGEVPGTMAALPWAAARQSTISFGQGIAVTPLQIMTGLTAFARHGMLINPRFIQRVDTPMGETIKQFPPRERQAIRPEIANQVLDMMIQVVEGKEGTGRAVRIPGYSMAGKTGTADKVVNGRYNGDVISSFICLFPARKPRYQIFVVLDSPQMAHYASETAVPLVREILQDMIKAYRIPPEKPHELLAAQGEVSENGQALRNTPL